MISIFNLAFSEATFLRTGDAIVEGGGGLLMLLADWVSSGVDNGLLVLLLLLLLLLISTDRGGLVVVLPVVVLVVVGIGMLAEFSERVPSNSILVGVVISTDEGTNMLLLLLLL